jgi:pre-mRNA-splicing factor CWC22
VDRGRAQERLRQLEIRGQQQEQKPTLTEAHKQAAAKKEYEDLLNKRSGGVYIPPARLRALQAQITDKTSKEYQRMAWEALKKSINGLINKVNVSNIKFIVPELFGENLVRGRGLFCRSIMKAQAASLPFSPIFAATAAIVNTKLPNVGELLARRLVSQFRKSFKRNDKAVAIASSTFLAHLCNQQVLNEMLIAQILLLLLHQPTDDSCEIAVNICKEVGQHLEEFNSAIAVAVFDQFRNILHEANELEKRTQYAIEVLFQVRKDKYKDYPAIREELDLVEEEDQITHNIDLDDEIKTEDTLNIFKFDPDYEANEQAYRNLKAQILGEADGSDDDDEDDSDESEDEEEAQQERALEIADATNQDLVNLRRSIYLTIKSSGLFEEAVHKLMKINLPVGLEEELPSMVIECASQERTFEKFYGQIAERFAKSSPLNVDKHLLTLPNRFCKLNRMWRELFERQFIKYYENIHRYETNRLRIIAQLFGHLLATDAIEWHVFSVIKLNQEDTTSSSRIFIKILFEELGLNLGMNKLVHRFKDDMLQPSLAGIFPMDDPKNTRFAINYFTAIQMGVLTEGMREWLANLPKPELKPLPEPESDSESASSYSSYSSRSRSRTPPRRVADRGGRRDSYSSSDSGSDSRSPPPRSRRARSPERSGRGRRDSYSSRSRSSSKSRSPPRRSVTERSRRHSSSPSRSPSRSRSPPRRRTVRNYSSSRSRSPRRRRRGARDNSESHSRSPPPRRPARSPSSGRSASPPPRRVARPKSETRSRSPTRRRYAPPSVSTRRRRNSSSDLSERKSRSPPRRRRNSSSEDERRSGSSPPRRGSGGGRNGHRD